MLRVLPGGLYLALGSIAEAEGGDRLPSAGLPLPSTLPGTSTVSFFAECLEIWLRLGSAQFFLLVSNLEAVSLHIGEPVVLLWSFRSPMSETSAELVFLSCLLIVSPLIR